jgi:hypothetical protein
MEKLTKFVEARLPSALVDKLSAGIPKRLSREFNDHDDTELQKISGNIADFFKESTPLIHSIIENLFREFRMNHEIPPETNDPPLSLQDMERQKIPNNPFQFGMASSVPNVSLMANATDAFSIPHSTSGAPSLYNHSNGSSQQVQNGSAMFTSSSIQSSPVNLRQTYELPEANQSKDPELSFPQPSILPSQTSTSANSWTDPTSENADPFIYDNSIHNFNLNFERIAYEGRYP